MSNIYRRGKTWHFRAQRDNKEFRRSLRTRDRVVAEKRARKLVDELEATRWGEKPERSYNETAERFIVEYLPTLKPAAAKRYGVSLVHLAEHFGGKMLSDISSGTLSDFESKRRTEGVMPGTIRRDIACLSSMLRSADDWEWLQGRNEALRYLKKRARRGLTESDARTRYLTEAEEQILLASASPDVADAIVLAIETGLRREELFGLTWEQINLKRGVITTTTRTKSGRDRKVPITARSAQILAHLPRSLTCPHVLMNLETGQRFVQRDKGLKAAMRRSRIKDLRWHDLRRTAGCRWLQRDSKSMEEVSILLGHSSVKVTEQRYAFLEAEAVAESEFGRAKTGTRDSVLLAFPVKKQ